ncbi:MAG: tRNA guanosine(34) transglycosylase Tgt [Nanoarchaeota archaeon]|jgi:queuine tRNA-ribosyltransferase|nr:tRNA guanosine(34) transglycosylase Tgt [Nanoarchaeota archaeon]|tara:strand:- start:24305 stop:25291 length:987 start_codon:yes stop_codon:yes gene_type:complete
MKTLDLDKKVKLPMFMPVATKLSTKLLSLKEVEEMDFSTVICNSFLLYLDPGLDLIKKAGGLREFTGTKLSFFSDSGGFQMISDEFLVGISKKGLKLRSPYDKSIHDLTPEKSMEIQTKLGADVVMCLDYMPRYGDKKEDIENSVNLTYEWAKRCKESYKGKGKLFCIVQGGIYKGLRKKSAELLKSLDFDGYAIGGLGIGETKEEIFEIVKYTVKLLPKDKPIYLMGIGVPEDIQEFIKLGVDIFDSCYPARVGRHGLVFTSKGNLDLEKGKFKEDFNPIEKDCKCEACKQSRAYIHYLIKIKEPLGKRLMSLHNLEFVKNLLSASS